MKVSNYFMPKLVKKPTEGGAVWSDGTTFAVGDCNLGCIGNPPNFDIHPAPKISYPGEEQALHAVYNMKIMAKTAKGKER